MPVKEKTDYKEKNGAWKPLTLFTDTPFNSGKRRGVLSIEEEEIVFMELITAKRKRSKQIARTAHFSVVERPDGNIAGTFYFNPSLNKIRGKLSAEFWQAITLALNVKNDDYEQNSTD